MAKPAVASRRILILLVITAFGLMTLDVRGLGPFDEARSTAFSVTSPFRSFVADVISPIGAAWDGAVHYDDLEEENARLRADVARLEGEVSRVPDVEADLAALQDATGLEIEGLLEQVTAKIISDRDTGIERIIEINRGSADGIVADMPVVVGSGLAGYVLIVSGEHQATIRLITDSRVDVGVTGVDSGQTAIASGDGEGASLGLELTAESFAEVVDGERFETSGFGRRYPHDIPVGTLVVDEINGSATLVPFVDFERLVFVSVVLTEQTP